MKGDAMIVKGRNRAANNSELTLDNRAHDLPMFERESPPSRLPTPAAQA
jgi:hypothetical protein